MAQKNILTNFTVVAGVEGQNTLQNLAKQLDGLSFSAKKLSKDLQASSGATGIQQITRDAKEAKSSVDSLADAFDKYKVQVFAAAAAATGFVGVLKGILKVQSDIDQLNAGLNIVNQGDLVQTAKDIEFLRKETDRLGLAFVETSALFTKVNAAAQVSGLTAESTREIFSSFAGTIGRLNLSADSSNRIFFALQQILSKNVVSSEELKNQLGEKLPGILAISAKAIGVNTTQLQKMLENGEVIATDFLPKLAKELQNTFNVDSNTRIESAAAATNRFKNAITELQQEIVGGGLGNALATLTEGVARNLDLIVGTATIFGFSKLVASMLAAKTALQAKAVQAAIDANETAKNALAAQAAAQASATLAAAKVREAQAMIAATGATRANQAALNNAAAASAAALVDLGAANAVVIKQKEELAKRATGAFSTIRFGAGRLLSFLGGPWVFGITTAATLAYQAYETFGRDTKSALDSVGDASDTNKQIVTSNSNAVIAQLQREIDQYNKLREVAGKAPSALDAAARSQSVISEEIKLLQSTGLFRGQLFDLNKDQAAIQSILQTLGAEYGKVTAKVNEFKAKQAEAFGEEAKKLTEGYLSKFGDNTEKLESALAAAREEYAKLNMPVPPEVEAAIRKKFIKPIKDLGSAVEKNNEFFEEAERLLSIYNDTAEQTNKIFDNGEKRIEDIVSQTIELERQNLTYGLGKDAIEELIIAELERKKVGASPEILDQIEREIEARKRLAGAISNRDALEEGKRAAEAQAKEFEKIQDDIAQSLTDAIFQGGKKGSEILKNLFKAQVFRIFIEPSIRGFVGSLAGAFGFGGAASAAEGAAGAVSQASGLGNLVSGVKSAFDFVQGGFASIGNAAFEGALKLAEFTSLSLESSLTFANGAALAAQTLAGIAGGIGAGRAISGGFAIGGGSGNSAVNIGTGIGAIAGGPLGALIGGAIGGFANRLFGRKTVLGASGIQGDFTGSGLSNAQTFQDVTQKGGLFRSSKSFTQFGALDPKALKAINEAFGDVSKAAQDASRALGANFTEAFKSFSLSGRLGGSVQEVLNNASNAFVTKIIDETLDGLADSFKEFLNSIKQDQEQLIDAYVRVSRSVVIANRALFALGQTAQFSIRNAETAFEIISVLGDQGIALLDQFVARFVPASQQAEIAAKNFELSLKNLGLETQLSANTTREEFRKLVQGLDLTTAAGQRQLQALLQIMPELDAIITRREQEKAAIKALSASIEANVERIRGDFQGLLDAIALRTDTTSLRITQAINSITAQPVIEFAAAISNAKPTDTVYRDFIKTVGSLQPSAGAYMGFVDAIEGFTPNTAAYRSFVDAVSGLKPTDVAYKQFVASVQGLKPSDALYKAFVDAVSAAKPSSTAFGGFVADVQGKTTLVNQALDLLAGQIDQLQDVVVTVNFSNFTTQINRVSADIARLGTEISNTTDVGARLQLEDQLQSAIIARYELEQQMLGGVFASIQELMGGIRNERVAVRDAATQILGGPRVLSADEIRAKIGRVSSLTQLPSLQTAELTKQEGILASRQGSLASIQAKQQAEILAKQKKIADAELAMLAVRPNYEKELSEVQEAAKAAIQVGLQFSTITAGGQTISSGSQYARFGIKQNDQGVSSRDNAYFVANTSAFNTAFREFAAAQDTYIGKLNALNTANKIVIKTTDEQIAAQAALVEAQVLEVSKARAEAEQKFAEQLQQFVIDAGKAASQLGKLREETVRYFQEQQRLAQALMASSQGLRQTVAEIRFADLNPQQQLAQLQSQFASLFKQASVLEGDALAAAGNDLNALINPILQKAGEVFASGAQFQAIKDALLAQAEQVAGRIESLTPVDYQQESLALLDTIDTTLALIEENTKSAEALIVDAIGQSADRTVAALAEIYRGITGNEIPAFAKGGMHSGGLRLVGERGPELEVTGPSRIIPNNQLMGMMRGNDNTEVVAELREANRLMQQQMRIMQATAQQNANDNAEMKQELQTLRKKVSLEASQ